MNNNKLKVRCLMCSYYEVYEKKDEDTINILRAMCLPCGHMGLSEVEEVIEHD